MSNSKSWCYTVNNYTDKDIEFFSGLECRKHVCGKEVGEKGTPHLQGYITFKNATRLTALKKLHGSAHWEMARSQEAAYNYCLKGEIIIQKNGSQGKRSDLIAVTTAIKEGAKLQDIKELYPVEYIKFHNGIEKLITGEKRNFKPEVFWFWGKTGTGKTRKVVEKEPDLWISGKNLKWWDGYEGQEAVLFDDFRKDFCTFHELLRILDRYPYRVEVKGGSREFNAKRIYITSCHAPEAVYETREDIAQLLRRIDVTEVFGDDEVVTEVGKGNTKLSPFENFIKNYCSVD